MCRMSRNSRRLNLLEPEWPVQACSRKALPLLNIQTVYRIAQGNKSVNKNDYVVNKVLSWNCLLDNV